VYEFLIRLISSSLIEESPKAKRTKQPVKGKNYNSFEDFGGDIKREIPIKSFNMEFKHGIQRLAWSIYQQHDILFMLGAAGVGKSHLAMAFAIEEILNKTREKIYLTRPIIEAGESLGFLPGPQPLDAKILTPTGWATMGSIKVGDYVIGRDGKQTKVLGVFPKGKKMVYRFTTTDNTVTECCEDHLWLTQTFEDKKRKRNGSVKSTKDIMSNLLTNKGKINHFIPRNEAVEFKKTILPLAPYVLGTLLGNGYLGNAVSLAGVDKKIMNRVNEEIKPINCLLTQMKTAKKVLVNSQEFSSLSVASKELNINLGTLKNSRRDGQTKREIY
jgi:hypothetical protein